MLLSAVILILASHSSGSSHNVHGGSHQDDALPHSRQRDYRQPRNHHHHRPHQIKMMVMETIQKEIVESQMRLKASFRECGIVSPNSNKTKTKEMARKRSKRRNRKNRKRKMVRLMVIVVASPVEVFLWSVDYSVAAVVVRKMRMKMSTNLLPRRRLRTASSGYFPKRKIYHYQMQKSSVGKCSNNKRNGRNVCQRSNRNNKRNKSNKN
mmetsp:Transcript_53068/g.128780  ORF Transcript_53068/g.128780 Transcript_53068/m.128780 type:complete len:209 (+) Transcript_53068:602-1228(+)